MNVIHYIGFDVHKKSVSYCAKTASGVVVDEGTLPARRQALIAWASRRAVPWKGGLEATLFSGWIYDVLKPYAVELHMGHPAMMKAIMAGKNKSDRLDSSKVSDLVRCDLLPRCYVAPPEIRELRRILRYRNLVVRQAVRMKNKTAGLLMEVGAEFNKKKLAGDRYFQDFLATVQDVPASVKELLRLSHGAAQMFEGVQRRLIHGLKTNQQLKRRVELLMTIPGVGEVTALTWALEVGEPQRFASVSRALSYCGLTAALRESAGKQQRGPLSKKRNAHLQTMLIEASKLAPRWNPKLAALHARELERGSRNRATVAVARKLVGYLLAVDRCGQPFQLRMEQQAEPAAETHKTQQARARRQPVSRAVPAVEPCGVLRTDATTAVLKTSAASKGSGNIRGLTRR